MMNFWTPSYDVWSKDLEDYDMPWRALYDYVEVYKYNEETKSFDMHWRDDFDFFDEQRWRSSHN